VGFVRRIYDRWLAYALSAPAAPERHYQPKGQPAGQPAGRRPPPPTTGTAIHRPDRILRTEHRRLLDEALLARDRLWLKRIQTIEMQVMFPFHVPLTSLIRATERDIDERARKLEPQSPGD
jgi:hypothetical protein